MTHKFHSGPLPHVGWWLCEDLIDIKNIWRWWDGRAWSWFFVPADPTPIIDDFVAEKYRYSKNIRWSHYWPENARVPRINPDTGEVTGGAA